MISINDWMAIFLNSLQEQFGNRVWFVGLQGSYSRGEATESSDIDVVVILDELSPTDIRAYRAMLDTLPHREMICGFLSGKSELLHWEPSDLFQFYFDTTPITGSLDELLSLLDRSVIDRAIKAGVCNIYHGCVHNMLHGQSESTLKGLYKSASFVLQAICFQQTSKYCRKQEDLLAMVSPEDRQIAERFLAIKKGSKIDFQDMSETLFVWCQHWIGKL